MKVSQFRDAVPPVQPNMTLVILSLAELCYHSQRVRLARWKTCRDRTRLTRCMDALQQRKRVPELARVNSVDTFVGAGGVPGPDRLRIFSALFGDARR